MASGMPSSGPAPRPGAARVGLAAARASASSGVSVMKALSPRASSIAARCASRQLHRGEVAPARPSPAAAMVKVASGLRVIRRPSARRRSRRAARGALASTAWRSPPSVTSSSRCGSDHGDDAGHRLDAARCRPRPAARSSRGCRRARRPSASQLVVRNAHPRQIGDGLDGGSVEGGHRGSFRLLAAAIGRIADASAVVDRSDDGCRPRRRRRAQPARRRSLAAAPAPRKRAARFRRRRAGAGTAALCGPPLPLSRLTAPYPGRSVARRPPPVPRRPRPVSGRPDGRSCAL